MTNRANLVFGFLAGVAVTLIVATSPRSAQPEAVAASAKAETPSPCVSGAESKPWSMSVK